MCERCARSAYAAPMADDVAPGADDEPSWLLAGPTAPDEVRRRYDDWAPEYDATLRAWGYDAPARAAALALDALGSDTSAHVLDAGCGTGLVGAAMRDQGFGGHVAGIDLSAASIDVAAGRQAYDSLGVADLQQPLDLGDGAFDAVVCVGVLSYVPDTEAIWREFARVTRRDGVVVCTQRADIWDERRCAEVLDRLERDGTWAVRHLSAPVAYMPGNADFGDEIGVRFLVARVR